MRRREIGACFKMSISGFKVHHSQTMLDTSFTIVFNL